MNWRVGSSEIIQATVIDGHDPTGGARVHRGGQSTIAVAGKIAPTG